jgi:hypothetical protein
MPTPIKLSHEVIDFLKSSGSVVSIGMSGSTYYYMPYWFRDLGDRKVEMLNFDELPDELKKEIGAMREKFEGKQPIK